MEMTVTIIVKNGPLPLMNRAYGKNVTLIPQEETIEPFVIYLDQHLRELNRTYCLERIFYDGTISYGFERIFKGDKRLLHQLIDLDDHDLMKHNRLHFDYSSAQKAREDCELFIGRILRASGLARQWSGVNIGPQHLIRQKARQLLQENGLAIVQKHEDDYYLVPTYTLVEHIIMSASKNRILRPE